MKGINISFVDKGTDESVLKSLSAENPSDDLIKAMNKQGLVQKEIQYKTPNGKIATRKQWVKATEEGLQHKVNQSWKEETSKEKRESVPATPFKISSKTKHLIPVEKLEELPEFIKKANIPPDWRNVMISTDPNPKSEILAIGKDSQDRPHYIYTQEHWNRVNAEKYKRVSNLIQKKDELYEFINKLKDTSCKDTADCLDLIYNTGLRPGSDRDTSAKVQAYGASTLQGKHVVIEENKVFLRFIGKKGVEQNHEITDKQISDMLVKRKEQSGDNGKLFPNTSDTKLRDALKPLGIHTKDLRTMLANVTAKEYLSNVEPTDNPKEFNRIRNLVGDAVCSKLGNQRSMSLKSYIDPSVFEQWSPEGMKNWETSKKSKSKENKNEE